MRSFTALLFILLAGLSATGVKAATFTTIYKFCPTTSCKEGSEPIGPLIVDEVGNLYGTASIGGKNDGGVVFKLTANPDRTEWAYKVLYYFCHKGIPCSDGFRPIGGLIRDINGALYGVAQEGGGNNGRGTLYRLSPDIDGVHWTYQVMHKFCGSDTCEDNSAYPVTSLTYDGAQTGALYDGVSRLYGGINRLGATPYGGIYSLTPRGRSWKYSAAYDFCCDEIPSGTPLFVDGSLYGLTAEGGDFDSGSFYRLSPSQGDTWTHTLLYSFDNTQGSTGGSFPVGPLVRTDSGKFFGTTETAVGIFSITVGNKKTTERGRYTFCQLDQCADGSRAYNGLIAGADGVFYGATEQGGSSQIIQQGAGTVFTFRNGKLATLHTFCTEQNCPDGYLPVALTMDNQANIFGVTTYGGNGIFDGTVFEITP